MHGQLHIRFKIMSLTTTHSRYGISRCRMRRSFGTVASDYFWFRFIPSRCLILHIWSTTTFLLKHIFLMNVLSHSCIINTWQNRPKHKPTKLVNTILLWNISRLIYHSNSFKLYLYTAIYSVPILQKNKIHQNNPSTLTFWRLMSTIVDVPHR